MQSAVDFWVNKNNASNKKIYPEVNEVRDGTSLFKETWSEGTNSEVQYWLFDGAGAHMAWGTGVTFRNS